MATRFTNPFPRFFTDNAALLSGGKLNFFEDDGGTTPKDTYSDNALTTANANPVILSSAGVIPDIFLDGAYRVTLENSDGVQVDEADNVNTGSNDAIPFAAWDSSISYNSGNDVIVTGSDGNYYRSTSANNLGNDPTTSPGDWDRVYLISDSDPQQGGALDANDNTYDGSSYRQIADASLGSGTHTFDYDDGDAQQLTATGNITIAFDNFPTGQVTSFIIDAINWGAHTITLPGGMLFSNGVEPDYEVSGTTRLEIYHDKDDILTMTVKNPDLS